jgi:hypothetical protein
MKEVKSYFPGFVPGQPGSGHIVVKVVKRCVDLEKEFLCCWRFIALICCHLLSLFSLCSLVPDIEVGRIYAGYGSWQRLAVFTEATFRSAFWVAQPESETPLPANLGIFGVTE